MHVSAAAQYRNSQVVNDFDIVLSKVIMEYHLRHQFFDKQMILLQPL
jgi:hypothetical protein